MSEATKLKYCLVASDAGAWGIDPDDTDTVIPVLRSTEIGLDGSVDTKAPALRSLTSAEKARTQLHEGDVLVVRSSGSDLHLGKAGYVNTSAAGLSFSNFLQRLRFSPEHSPRFGWYFLNSLRAKQQIRKLSSTTTGLQNLGASLIAELEMPTPPLDAQRRIVDFLDAATARIEALLRLRDAQLALLREKRFSIVREVLIRGIHGMPTKKTDLAWLPEIPEDWNLAPLRYLTVCLDGKRVPLSSVERSERSGPYPYYGASRVVGHVDDYIFNEPLVLLGEDGAQLGNPNLEISFYVEGKIWVNNHAHVLRPTAIDGRLLSEVLNVFDRNLYMSGSTREKITQDEMNRILVPVPPTSQQEQLVNWIGLAHSNRRELEDALRKQTHLLAERRQALITAAVTGQFDVTTASGRNVTEGVSV